MGKAAKITEFDQTLKDADNGSPLPTKQNVLNNLNEQREKLHQTMRQLDEYIAFIQKLKD